MEVTWGHNGGSARSRLCQFRLWRIFFKLAREIQMLRKSIFDNSFCLKFSLYCVSRSHSFLFFIHSVIIQSLHATRNFTLLQCTLHWLQISLRLFMAADNQLLCNTAGCSHCMVISVLLEVNHLHFKGARSLFKNGAN